MDLLYGETGKPAVHEDEPRTPSDADALKPIEWSILLHYCTGPFRDRQTALSSLASSPYFTIDAAEASEIVERLVGLQARILDVLWPHLVPGGMLVYVTCSLLPEENQNQVQAFLQRTPDARELPIEAEWGRACPAGRQVLTGDDGMDGFYFARLRKEAADR